VDQPRLFGAGDEPGANAGLAFNGLEERAAVLAEAAARLTSRFPTLDVRPIVGDFARTVTLPADLADRPRTGFFPGSTIGNLIPAEAASLLQAFDAGLGAGGRLIVAETTRSGIGALVGRRADDEAYASSGGATAALEASGFVGVRVLAEREGARFVEGARRG